MLTCKSSLAHILTGWQIGLFFVISTDFHNPGTNIVVAALNILGPNFREAIGDKNSIPVVKFRILLSCGHLSFTN